MSIVKIAKMPYTRLVTKDRVLRTFRVLFFPLLFVSFRFGIFSSAIFKPFHLQILIFPRQLLFCLDQNRGEPGVEQIEFCQTHLPSLAAPESSLEVGCALFTIISYKCHTQGRVIILVIRDEITVDKAILQG